MLKIPISENTGGYWRPIKTHQLHNPAGVLQNFRLYHGIFKFPFRNVFQCWSLRVPVCVSFNILREKFQFLLYVENILLFTESRIWLRVQECCYSILWEVYFSFPILLRSGFPAEVSLPSQSLSYYNSPSQNIWVSFNPLPLTTLSYFLNLTEKLLA